MALIVLLVTLSGRKDWPRLSVTIQIVGYAVLESFCAQSNMNGSHSGASADMRIAVVCLLAFGLLATALAHGGVEGAPRSDQAPAAREPRSQKALDFAHDIVPIIRARCAECHT